jgi:hypothetical protein
MSEVSLRPVIVRLDQPEKCEAILGFSPRQLIRFADEQGAPIHERADRKRSYVVVDEFVAWFQVSFPLRDRGVAPHV